MPWSGNVVRLMTKGARCTAVPIVLGCILAGTMVNGCLDPTAREASGVCYPEEHLDDQENCACEGPCQDGLYCEDGLCQSICGEAACPPFCGNGSCEPEYSENCFSCPGDCGCTENNRYRFTPAVVVLDDSSPVFLAEKQDDGALVLQGEETALQQIVPGTILLANPEHGAVYIRVLSTTESEGVLVVTKSEVPQLDEVFEEAVFRLRLPVDFSQAVFEGEVADRVQLSSGGKADSGDLDTLYIDLSGLKLLDLTLKDRDGNSATVKVSVKSGHFELVPAVIFDLDLTWTLDLERLELSVAFESELYLELERLLAHRLKD